MKKLFYLMIGAILTGCSEAYDEQYRLVEDAPEKIGDMNDVNSETLNVSEISSILKEAGFLGKTVVEENVTPILGGTSSRGENDTLLYIDKQVK